MQLNRILQRNIGVIALCATLMYVHGERGTHMRLLLFRLFLVLAIAVNCLPEETYAQSKLKEAVQIYDAAKQLQDFYAYQDYAEKSLKNAKNGRTPPPLPSKIQGGGSLLSKLNNVEAAISQIKFPTPPKSSQVSVEQFSSQANEKRRVAISQLVKNSQDLAEHVRALEELNLALGEAKKTQTAVRKSSKELSDAFKSAAQYSTFPQLYNLFGFSWLEMEQNLIPAINRIGRALTKKQEQLTKELNLQRNLNENLKSNLNLILDGEEQDLMKKQAELESDFKSIQEESESLQDKIRMHDNLIDQIRDQSDTLQKKQQTLSNQEKSFNSAVDKYNRGVSNLKSQERKIKKFKYTTCPNKKAFNVCNHTQQKNAYVNKRNGMVSRYNKSSKRLGNESSSVKRLKTKLEQNFSAFNKEAEEFSMSQEKLKELSEEINLIQEKLKNEFIEIFEKTTKNQQLIKGNQDDRLALEI